VKVLGYDDRMSIWFKPYTIEELAAWRGNTMVEHLDIRFREVGPDYLVGSMPVDRRTHQTMGILHGGASMVLAETLGSIGANMCLDTRKQVCVGQEINGNHLRPVRTGEVIGTARPIHRGSRSQVWQIDIHDEAGRLVCVSRLTLAIVDQKPELDMRGGETR
jgi:1,4-dihydroxy-2-naphthoyl-CoA hydrolase